jgi:hypothetical protein
MIKLSRICKSLERMMLPDCRDIAFRRDAASESLGLRPHRKTLGVGVKHLSSAGSFSPVLGRELSVLILLDLCDAQDT